MEEPKAILRVLLAERDDEFRKIAAAALEQCDWIELVASVQDGTEALRLTMEKRPDVVVLDAMLAQLDGLTIASMLKKKRLRIDVMLMTVFTSPQFEQDCTYLQIAHVLKKPFLPRSILERLEVSRSSKLQQQVKQQNMLCKKGVTGLMHKLTFQQGTKGYFYVNEAILYELLHEGAVTNITKQIYPELTRKFGNNPKNIERAMRNAIENMVKTADPEWLEKYFGPTSCWKKGRPSNAAFIARAAELLRQEDIEQILQTD